MRSLLFNSCWTVGLALLLASFSYQYRQALYRERSVVRQLQRSSFVAVAWISLALVAVGAAGTSRRTWESALWILLVVYAMWQAGAVWLSRKQIVEE